MIQRLYLILKEIVSSRIISLIVLCTIIVSVFSYGVFEIINENLENYVHKRFINAIPPNTIHVFPKQPGSAVLLTFRRGKQGVIRVSNLWRIRRMKEVKSVLPLLIVSVPMNAAIPAIGRRIDPIAAVGAPYYLVKNDLKTRRLKRLWKKAQPGNVLPVLIPRGLIKAYNVVMAAPNVMPWISEKGAKGLSFQLSFGRSDLRTLPDYVDETAFVAGFAASIEAIALILPLNVAEAYNRKFNNPYNKEFYSLYVTVKNHNSLIKVSRAIRRMGFDVETDTSVSRRILQLQRNITLITDSMKYLIVFLSIVAVCFSTIIATFSRLEYYRIMRIVGASKMFLAVTILIKYMVLGFIGVIVSVFCISILTNYISGLLRIAGIIHSIEFPELLQREIFVYGILFPVLATIPALIRLYIIELNRD